MDILLTFETGLTDELVDTIDKKLAEVIAQAASVEDPDSLGYFDSAEHLTGLGFVACQAYTTAVYGVLGIKKYKALPHGPHHQSGRSIAQIVNGAANYWKHNNEWHLDKKPERREAIETMFEEVGFPVDTEYPLSGVLMELASPYPASFRAIFQKLQEWKGVLQNGAA